MKRITDEERIEMYFTTAPHEDCLRQIEKINFILRIRGAIAAPPVKRGRKPKAVPPMKEAQV